MMLDWLVKIFWSPSQPGLTKREEQWLSQSSDLVELERRIKKLENQNLRGWV